jgi:tetratricopeptide (TPR) repeat protein
MIVATLAAPAPPTRASAKVDFDAGMREWQAGRPRTAVQHFGAAVDAYTKLILNKGGPDLSGLLAQALRQRGIARSATGLYAAAIDDFGRAIAILKRLVVQNHSNARVAELSGALMERGGMLCSVNRAKEAVVDFKRAIDLSGAVESTPSKITTARAFEARGYAHQLLGERSAAVKDYDAAIGILNTLRKGGTTGLDSQLAGAVANRAITHLALANYDRVVSDCNAAIPALRALIRANPRRLDLHHSLATSLRHRGIANKHLEKLEASANDFEEALAIRVRQARGLPKGQAYAPHAEALVDCASALYLVDRVSEALSQVDSALRKLTTLVEKSKQGPVRATLARGLHTRAQIRIHPRLRQNKEAIVDLERARAVYTDLFTETEDPDVGSELQRVEELLLQVRRNTP